MKKTLVLLLLCFFYTETVLSQESLFNLYKTESWSKLEQKLIPILQKQPHNVPYNYLAGKLYGNTKYPDYSYDKAYKYLVAAKSDFGKLSASEKEKYAKYVSSKRIQKDLDTVCSRLYEITMNSNSVETCNSFLSNYKRVSEEQKEAVTNYRNMMAFAETQKINTIESYQTFISKYPNANEIPVAKKRSEKLAFEETMQKNNSEAFMNFMKKYPKSEYSQQIQKLYVERIFSDTDDGNYKSYEQFVKANPQNELSKVVIRKMMSIAKSQKDLWLMQKTVEYSREIDFEYVLYEFYKEFTKDGESLTLYNFVNMYPRTFLDTLIAKDMKVAMKGDLLELIEPFDSVKSYSLFSDYIKMAAPKEKAFVALQKLISEDIAAKRWKNAIRTVKTYSGYFGQNNQEIINLINILSATEDKTIVIKDFPDNINTKEGGEYSPIITADSKYLYFCGKDRADNVGGEDIFVSEWENDKWSNPEIVKTLSTPTRNEAVISISTDGTNLLYFQEGVIFLSEKDYYGWNAGKNVSNEINNAKWSADAMITSDGNAIIFSSVRENDGYNLYTKQNASLGVYHGAVHHQSDIYVSLKTDNGWGKPINLGPVINTIYTDRSPFLHHDMKTLYFSSDGHGGLGNLDVFVSTRLSDTCWDCWSEPVNLGKEINSSEENWGYRIAPNGKDFYYAARKTGSKQNDLKYITIPQKFRPESVVNVSGKITNNQGKAVETKIVWEDLSSGKVIEKSQSNPSNGDYFAVLPQGKMYGYYVDDERYYPQSQNIDLTKSNDVKMVTKDIAVTSYSEMKEQKQAVVLNNLFFDTDKSNLLPYSIPELKRAAKIIIANNLRVEISGHTDNVGNDDYNMSLSLRRAEEVRTFLINEGCSTLLFEVKGYGESQPSSTNETVEGRAKNRRVEMRFL